MTSPKDVRDVHLPVTIESQTEVFRGFRKMDVIEYVEDGSGLRAKRELVEGRHAVAVVVFDPQLEKLVMIRQFRLGAQLGTGHGFTCEIVAGLIDEGEEPINSAKRELTEETGLVAKRIEPLCQFLTTPGLTSEVIHLFYAEVDASNMARSAGMEDETEQTFPFLLTYDEAMEAVDQNAIFNGIVMLGLMWFSRHRDKLGQ
jgi:ADP-ribose pyrophosphatase